MITDSVSFGFGIITAQHDARDPRTRTELYADVLELSARAETAGFDAVWLSEHHFVDDGYLPSLLPVAAAIAARTSRVAIGTGVLLAPFYDPLRLAEDASTVDLLSAGRLVLGLGAGYRDEEFAGFGVAKQALGSGLDHTIDTLRAAWSGAPVSSAPGRAAVSVTPRPDRPLGPPIWLGARSAAGLRRTGRSADGLIAARVDPTQFGEQLRALDLAAVAHGRDPGDLSVSVHCPVLAWPAADRAWTLLEPHLHYSEWKYADMSAAHAGRRTGAVPPRLGESARTALRRGALVGGPDEVADGIAAYARAAQGHPFHFIARLYWPGLAPDVQRELIAVFGAQVVPAVRDRLA